MINTLKTVLPTPTASVFVSRLPSQFVKRASTVSFATATDSQDNNMDKTGTPNDKTGDVMSHSFGEGYATRSDEEGFGGIYGGNQTLQKEHEIHENHPDYDKTQGREVKEKEKGRNQK